ncbi:MAG: MgtC/SapB family protein [Candidatus Pacebacteria bacterium]|nr:MgtC/SapB family protein [Candidatus Paceibacterota bacterium]
MFSSQIQIFIQLLLAAFLGAILGLEREYTKKEAGLRTYSLVSLASAFFTIISFKATNLFLNSVLDFDPSRIIGQIVLGVGFLGAGLIIYRQQHIDGLTTAAGLWLASAVGAAAGVGLYFPAFFVTFLGIAILAGLRLLEERVFKTKNPDEK